MTYNYEVLNSISDFYNYMESIGFLLVESEGNAYLYWKADEKRQVFIDVTGVNTWSFVFNGSDGSEQNLIRNQVLANYPYIGVKHIELANGGILLNVEGLATVSEDINYSPNLAIIPNNDNSNWYYISQYHNQAGVYIDYNNGTRITLPTYTSSGINNIQNAYVFAKLFNGINDFIDAEVYGVVTAPMFANDNKSFELIEIDGEKYIYGMLNAQSFISGGLRYVFKAAAEE